MAKIPDSVGWERTGTVLGAGGQSQVFEVKPKDPSKFKIPTYAMKVLRNIQSFQAKKRFWQEISAISKVSDPRIIEIVDINKEGAEFLYYVMPHYGSEFAPLDKVVFSEESPFRKNPIRCLEFVAECAEALEKVHQEKIIHRDIKPGNLLYHSKTFKPIILDFGCCQIDGGEAITLTDEAVGTRNYMAPECEAGSGANPTPMSDVYSLGKLLWTLVTGQQPFARESPVFTVKNLRKIFPEDPDCWHLTRIFEKTIRRDPANRFQTANALAVAIRHASKFLVGRCFPFELIGQICPMCGESLTQADNKYEVPLHSIFGNPMPRGTAAMQCRKCGYLWAWDYRPLRDRAQELEKMD